MHPRCDDEMRVYSKKKDVGGSREGDTPGPIPNPAVKPLSANGTAACRGRVGRCRRPIRSLFINGLPGPIPSIDRMGPFLPATARIINS